MIIRFGFCNVGEARISAEGSGQFGFDNEEEFIDDSGPAAGFGN